MILFLSFVFYSYAIKINCCISSEALLAVKKNDKITTKNEQVIWTFFTEYVLAKFWYVLQYVLAHWINFSYVLQYVLAH